MPSQGNVLKSYASYKIQSGGDAILGAIVGGSSLEERSRCAKEVAKRNVSGYLMILVCWFVSFLRTILGFSDQWRGLLFSMK